MANPLKYRELLNRLKPYGIVCLPPKRGKGSHVMLFMPEEEGSTKGPKYPLKHHSDNDDVSAQVIKAALRGFGIDVAEFFKPKKSK